MSGSPSPRSAAAAEPELRGSHPVWADRGRRAEVRFVGRSPDPSLADASRAAVLAAVVAGEPEPPAGPAAARQVHGATVLAPPASDDDRGAAAAGAAGTAAAGSATTAAATAGAAERAAGTATAAAAEDGAATAAGVIACGEGDALVTDRAGLALSVISADCVPVLIEAGDHVAAVHAGWRGLVAGVVAATARRLAAGGAPGAGEWIAWIGPTIGACCYEVDDDVAAQVAAASSPAVVSRPHPGPGGSGGAAKPHLDLVAAARHQLAALGVADVRTVAACTRCEPDLLWSYRRLGRRAGRNHAFIWLRRD